MVDVNRVTVTGRLTADPTLAATASGTSVLTVPLSFSAARPDGRGGWEQEANYVDVSVYGRRAEGLARVLRKGSFVCVDGRLRWRQWERDGQRRTKLDVVASEVSLPPRAGRGAAGEAGAGDGYGEEVPF